MNKDWIRQESNPNGSKSLSPFPYPGGKGRKSKWIIDRIPPHDTFVEAFGGSGAITYNKPPSKYEIYNDVNDDLVQFFRILRTRPDELIDFLNTVPYSRSLYERWVTEHYSGYRPDDPIRRAGRFFALRYMQISGEMTKRNGFKTRASRSPARSFSNGVKQLDEIANRFSEVIIEHQDYADLFSNYDDTSVDVLFYCDIPYIGTEHVYGRMFNQEAFVEAISEIDSEWMVSCDEVPKGLDDLGYVQKRNRRHRMNRSEGEVVERLVCSFDPSSTSNFVSSQTEQTRIGDV